ncbi:hypothetical protein Gohar_018575 [Gossypium harknessii]|uniref:Uncharacterized protein n=1 Tax=Gossypium harknessii TaxID=34285 RepID=A0A7J9GBM7_9ROSI|nr:hypothetical protein [Gossypium harknessii]
MVESDTKSGLLESLHNVHSFDSEGNNSPKFDTRIDMGNPDLKTRMVFANREILKEAIRQYGSLNRYKSEFILGAKDKLILTCVDTIMTKIIQRIAQKKEAKKVIEPLCPKIQKKLDTKTELCNRCWPMHVGGLMYQVACGPSHNMWNSINVLTIMMMLQERLESYADPCYPKTTYISIYSHLIKPIRGAKQWSQVLSIEPIQPLVLRRPPGKPRKARKKGVDEAQLLVKDGRGGHANELHEMWWSIRPQCQNM